MPFLSFGQIEPTELCDSIFVSFVEYNSEQGYIEIDVSVEYLSQYSYGYAGFELVNYQGDVIATETVGTAGNVYSLSSGMFETRFLQLTDNFSLPFNGTINLVNGLFAGVPETACSWPFYDSSLYTYVPDDDLEYTYLIEALQVDDVMDNYVLTENINGLVQVGFCWEEDDNYIMDMTGIEDFTALADLCCRDNLISYLDLSNNLNLEQINADNNAIDTIIFPNTNTLWWVALGNNLLESLSFEPNNNFEMLHLNVNNFQSINISQHTNLILLELNSNPLESIDVSNNLELEDLDLRDTELEELDVSQNTNLSSLDVRFNPSLSCIQVWDVDYANSMPFFSKDDDAIWSLDCENAYGCTDALACNYNSLSEYDDGSCEYAEEYYDCEGNCLEDLDADGVCNENEVYGCTDIDSCNWNVLATEDDNSCFYGDEVYDCEGNCLEDADGDEVCNQLDNCPYDYNPDQEIVCEDNCDYTINLNLSAEDAFCFGSSSGTAWTNLNGAFAPYTWEWSNGETSSSIDNLAPGTYSCTVTDVNGCSETSSITVYEPQSIEVNIYINYDDSSLMAEPSGGVPPYFYLWSSSVGFSSVSPTITNPPNGLYSVLITDSNGCVTSATVDYQLVSLNELSNHKNLITTVDILGKVTNNKGFQLHLYDDGTVEKKYLIK